jgi:hypothetical protein
MGTLFSGLSSGPEANNECRKEEIDEIVEKVKL